MPMVPSPQPPMAASPPINHQYMHPSPGFDTTMPANWNELQVQYLMSTRTDMGPAFYQQQINSPTNSNSYTDVTLSEDGSYCFVAPEPYVSPEQTLYHHRAWSESSHSDLEQQHPFANLDMGPNRHVYSPTPQSDSDYEYDFGGPACQNMNSTACTGSSHSSHSSTALVRPIPIPSSSSKDPSPVRTPGSLGSAGSPGRKAVKKSPIAVKGTEHRIAKKTSTEDKVGTGAKKVGKRKGPLKLEQRIQAGEIRKLRACLRCKFLKKTCDKGEPCAGCQPSHARLWQVPCTRIDIKEIGYFLKDKRFDYERHVSLGFSIGNIKGFSDVEKTLYVTHGYGEMLPIKARDVYVRDDKCLKMDWVEANGGPTGFEVSTAKLSTSAEGISTTVLSDYLDRHIDGHGIFEKFVDDYFEGTPFLSDMLKVAYQFYYRTHSRIIKKALKLMLAYNLTLHITMVEGVPLEEGFIGKIEDETSKFYGKTMAPVMINFQIKCAMADMWRELHKDVLEELSSLYSSVYSGDKLKNWPTIFILASVLLAVWEFMQFDCHYRVPDEAAVDKFCTDMETTPVGVIVGLFSAISQKLPSILEWDSSKHHALLGSNEVVCDTMSQVRDHVIRHGTYFNITNLQYC